ncbi:hypothetical protein [Photorhabdus africana]|uniref:hypothetical protein n=1 Tax=Photorhabdus africana TaxID=3097554 RepID=UPI002B4160C4|nr:hypothetical protein [Photorhabdus sp. CRI-LC]
MPKALIHIGDKPILWHIMTIYSRFGYNEFILCVGYKGHVIKDYFVNYANYSRDFTIHMGDNYLQYHTDISESK